MKNCIQKKPDISVVMAVFNGETYLEEAIRSILNQTFRNFEFIIINDGSTDRTLDIILNFKYLDPRIILINRENKGLPYSLNEGISVAKGKYIARMDADDISLPERFAIQFDYMESHPNIGVCGSSVFILNKNKIFNHAEEHESLKARLLFSVCFVHPTVFMRKDILTKLPFIYNDDFSNSQDYELWSRLVDITQFHNIQKPLLSYRLNEYSITHNVDKNGVNNRFPLVSSIYLKYLDKLNVIVTKEQLLMHFFLALNSEMKNLKKSISEVHKYLNFLIKSNYKTNCFDKKILYEFLAYKFFIFVMIRIMNSKKIDFNVFKFKLFYFGGWLVLRRLVRLKFLNLITS